MASILGGHDGVPVTSPASGTVSFVGVVVDRPVITIDHGNGLRSSFEPVESPLTAGAAVAKGESSARSRPATAAPLRLRPLGRAAADDYVNPLAFVTDLRPSILLPVSRAGPVSSHSARGWTPPPVIIGPSRRWLRCP